MGIIITINLATLSIQWLLTGATMSIDIIINVDIISSFSNDDDDNDDDNNVDDDDDDDDDSD